ESSHNPFTLEYLNVKFWLVPLPVLGVTESTVGSVATGAVVFHVPSGCHPLSRFPLSPARPYTACVPLKDGLNAMASISASVLPVPTAALPAPSIVHWPLDNVPAVPSVSGPVTLEPALSYRYSALLAGT